MPESLSTAGRLTIICNQFNIPRSVIEEALDNGTITEVGYAGRHIIDAVDLIRVVNAYRERTPK